MTESTPEDTCWYFAYGSNLCSSILINKRGVTPRLSKAVFLPHYSLCFNVLFLPYSEPAMAGLKDRDEGDQPVFGVAYLLTASDLLKIVVTEGAGVAYSIFEAEAKTLNGNSLRVSTLIARRERSFSELRFPSERYMVIETCCLPRDRRLTMTGSTFKRSFRNPPSSQISSVLGFTAHLSALTFPSMVPRQVAVPANLA